MTTRRRVGVGCIAAAIIAIGLAPGPALTAGRIDLPTPADVTSPDLPILQPRQGETEESRLPGPVSDDETVRVEVDPSGAVASVKIDQTLTLQGVGDFDIILPGPATHIVGPSDQSIQPGLRRGEILWNGFSPGTKTLTSTVTMEPTFERFHLPLTFAIRYLQGGRVVRPPLTGLVTIEIHVANATGHNVTMADAVPDRVDAADLLDALRLEVVAGRRPIAGTRGVPPSVGSSSRIAPRNEKVLVPMNISGSVNFPRGSLSVTKVTGGDVVPQGPAGTAVGFRALLPSDRFADGSATLRIEGIATALAAPQLNLRATGSLPDVALLEPRPASSWRRSLAGADDTRLRDALALSLRSMWQVLLLPEVDAHLGNPGKGPSRTVFYFTTAKPAAAQRVVAVERFRPGALALALIALALVIGNSALLWAKS